MINLIFASDYKTGVIGNKGDLPWGRLPKDLKFFKKKTEGHTVVMGRKTYESIGKPLPNRHNIVMSRNYPLTEGIALLQPHELSDFIEYASSKEVFIIGGAEIFKLFLPHADKIYHTVIHGEFEGDTFFPQKQIDLSEWEGTFLEQSEPDEKNPYYMDFWEWKKKKIGCPINI